MPIVEWSDGLSVKIGKFDDEHKKLIALINKLYDAMSQGQGHKVLEAMLVELTDYTKNHFKREEEAMTKHNYPAYAEHKKAHEEFVKTINETQEQYEKGTITLTVPTLNFLTSWVKNHIMKMDSGYSEFFTKVGLK